MKTILRFIAPLVLLLSVACGPAASPATADVPQGPRAWIDAPLDNSSLPQAEYQVISHASNTGGISAFELSINGQVLSTDPVPADQVGKDIAHISQAWLPPAPGTYLIEVRAKNANGAFGPSASARVTVGGLRANIPTLSPPPSVTPTASALQATGLQNTNCHTGPGGSYDVTGTLAKGQAVQIDGVNTGGTWLWVQHPNFKGRHCWVSIPFVQVQGSLAGLPVIPAPPLPPANRPHATPSPTTVHQ